MIKTQEEAKLLAAQNHITDLTVVFGYRSKQSKYGAYDDTFGLLTVDGYTEYKANTLPSIDRAGVAVLQPGVYKYVQGLHGISHLQHETNGALTPADEIIYNWLMQNKGKDYPRPVLDEQGHTRLLPYWALRQAGPVKIHRIGAVSPVMDEWPGNPAWIDIHKGGYNLTSSLGCQTDYPDTWDTFRSLCFGAMDKAQQTAIYYILIQL